MPKESRAKKGQFDQTCPLPRQVIEHFYRGKLLGETKKNVPPDISDGAMFG